MRDFKNIAAIIPALNESSTIASVVAEIRTYGVDVYVVDDNSTDKTADKARKAGAHVLRLPYSAGAWCATQAGLLYAIKQERYDAFITMDADGQHKPEAIPLLLETYKTTSANVLIGSYPQRGSSARKLAWTIFGLLSQLGVQDMTSGFRLYDSHAANVLLSREAALLDYQDIGVLLLLRRNDIQFVEVAVTMCDRTDGYSRVFNSWFSVGIYIVKTCAWILADWVSGQSLSSDDWTDYDAV